MRFIYVRTPSARPSADLHAYYNIVEVDAPYAGRVLAEGVRLEPAKEIVEALNFYNLRQS
jgi:hypothetical protein